MYTACYNCQYNNCRMSLCNGCLIQNIIYLKKNTSHGLMFYYQLKKFLVGR